jgi:tRNA(Ile)-lysidine synthase
MKHARQKRGQEPFLRQKRFLTPFLPGGVNGEIVSVLSRSVGVKRHAPLVAEVARRLRRWRLPPGGVVAVSGGADSVALLRALAALAGEAPPAPLVVAHLNHQLRGAESDDDEAFVRSLWERLDEGSGRLAWRGQRRDVAALARAEGGNLEAVARRVRYAWLTQVAEETGSTWVATGHTADDQAETVLHRLLRGTGLQGLRGIAGRRPLRPGVELVRPLLGVTRGQVLAYLDGEGQDYRSDSSNLDPAFTRNRIRHELLPLLAAHYNPAVVEVLARMAEHAEEVYEHEEALARALLAEVERPRAGLLLILDRAALAAAPRRLVRELYRLLWQREGWSLDPMTFRHWDRLAELVEKETGVLELPDGIRARAAGRVVQLGLPS